MKTEFRNRAFLPIVLPLGLMAAIGLLVGAFALILLYVNREAAIALAIAAASGVLIATALASAKEKTDEVQKGAVALAGATPIVVGILLATGIVGGLNDVDRNINREPHGAAFAFDGILEGAPVLAATSPLAFCIPEGDTCTDTKTWTFSFDAADGVISYAFDNQNAAVEHNLFLYGGEGLDLSTATESFVSLALLTDNPEFLLTPEEPASFAGPAAQTYEWTIEEGQDVPTEAYFVCTIHPTTMFGVAQITAA